LPTPLNQLPTSSNTSSIPASFLWLSETSSEATAAAAAAAATATHTKTHSQVTVSDISSVTRGSYRAKSL
jgi:hypothetical protein